MPVSTGAAGGIFPRYIEEATTLLEEVGASLEAYDGGTTDVVIEIEYEHVGGATPAAAKCIAWVFARFRPMPIGVVAVRAIAGSGGVPSQHSWGNAVDFMCSGEKHRQGGVFLHTNRGPLSLHWLRGGPSFPPPLPHHNNPLPAALHPQAP